MLTTYFFLILACLLATEQGFFCVCTSLYAKWCVKWDCRWAGCCGQVCSEGLFQEPRDRMQDISDRQPALQRWYFRVSEMRFNQLYGKTAFSMPSLFVESKNFLRTSRMKDSETHQPTQPCTRLTCCSSGISPGYPPPAQQRSRWARSPSQAPAQPAPVSHQNEWPDEKTHKCIIFCKMQLVARACSAVCKKIKLFLYDGPPGARWRSWGEAGCCQEALSVKHVINKA